MLFGFMAVHLPWFSTKTSDFRTGSLAFCSDALILIIIKVTRNEFVFAGFLIL